MSRATLEKEAALKDREISQLVADVHMAQTQISELRKRLEATQTEAEASRMEARDQLSVRRERRDSRSADAIPRFLLPVFAKQAGPNGGL